MPIDYQLMLQMAYEMPRQRLTDLQATFELMEARALRSKGLSEGSKASNADDRPVSTDSIGQPWTTLVGTQNRFKDSRKIIPIGFAGKRPELTIRQ